MKFDHRFNAAVFGLVDCGFLQNIVPVGENAFTATETQGWRTAAYEAAGELPGFIRPYASGGFCWQLGANIGGIVMPPNQHAKVLAARQVVREVTGDVSAEQKLWTVGACSRALLRFVGEKEVYTKSVERIMNGRAYGYHECTPGRYTTQEDSWAVDKRRDLFDEPMHYPNPAYIAPVTLYDVKSYYYDMLCRLPSLRININRQERIRFFPMLPDNRERWIDVLHAIADNKQLRNSIAGSMTGSVKTSVAFTSSGAGGTRTINVPGAPGMFRSAGLLVVATGAELCYAQCASTDSVYSSVDSVAIRGAGTPDVWTRHGFTTEVKCAGDAHIIGRGCYKIGQFATKPYKNTPMEIAVPRVPVAQGYTKQWL